MYEKINHNKYTFIYSGVLGTLYMVYGIAEMFYSIGIDLSNFLLFPFWSDPFAGFSLLVVGLVFIYPMISRKTETPEKIAYVYVGRILATLLLVIHILVILANYIECYILLSEDFAGWTWWNDFNPAIPLGLLALPTMVLFYRSNVLQGSQKS